MRRMLSTHCSHSLGEVSYPRPAAFRDLPRYPSRGRHKHHERYLAQHDGVCSTGQERTRRGVMRRYRKIVDNVGYDENDCGSYPRSRPHKEQDPDERVDKRQAGPIGRADRIDSAIVPEQSMSKQRTGMIEPTY